LKVKLSISILLSLITGFYTNFWYHGFVTGMNPFLCAMLSVPLIIIIILNLVTIRKIKPTRLRITPVSVMLLLIAGGGVWSISQQSNVGHNGVPRR
jgi:hypothetical protein